MQCTSLRLPAYMEPVVDELRKRFCEQFGREPGPEDPLFFDPDVKYPVPLPPQKLNRLWEELANTWLLRGEISAETAYAMKATGMFVREEDLHLLNPKEMQNWSRALDEYRRFAFRVTCEQLDSKNANERNTA